MGDHIYVLAASPVQPSGFPNFFESGRGSFMELLERPDAFRLNGWDLHTYDNARIVDGEFLQVSQATRKKLQLYEDGTLFVKAAADSTLLGWGVNSVEFAERPRLNPLALIELTTAFVHFYSKLASKLAPLPNDPNWHVELNDAS